MVDQCNKKYSAWPIEEAFYYLVDGRFGKRDATETEETVHEMNDGPCLQALLYERTSIRNVRRYFTVCKLISSIPAHCRFVGCEKNSFCFPDAVLLLLGVYAKEV